MDQNGRGINEYSHEYLMLQYVILLIVLFTHASSWISINAQLYVTGKSPLD